MKPTCANAGTNRANGGTNASFCTSGDFPFFLACGQICFEFESATVKQKRKNEGKEILWPKAKTKDFFNLSQGFVFAEIDDCLHLCWIEVGKQKKSHLEKFWSTRVHE